MFKSIAFIYIGLLLGVFSENLAMEDRRCTFTQKPHLTLTKNIFSNFHSCNPDMGGPNLPVGTRIAHSRADNTVDTWEVEETYTEKVVPAGIEKVNEMYSSLSYMSSQAQFEKIKDDFDKALRIEYTEYSDCLVKLLKKSSVAPACPKESEHLRERVIFGNNVSSYYGQIEQGSLLKPSVLDVLSSPKKYQTAKGVFKIENECDLFDNDCMVAGSTIFIGNNNRPDRVRTVTQLPANEKPGDVQEFEIEDDTNIMAINLSPTNDKRTIELLSPVCQQVTEKNRWYADTKVFNKRIKYVQTRSKHSDGEDSYIREITDKTESEVRSVTTRQYTWLSKGAMVGLATSAALATWRIYAYLNSAH